VRLHIGTAIFVVRVLFSELLHIPAFFVLHIPVLQLGTALLVVGALFNKLCTTIFPVLHRSILLVVLLDSVFVLFGAFSLIVYSIIALRRFLKLINLGGDGFVIWLRLGLLEKRHGVHTFGRAHCICLECF
jgi:hypothetical protein